MEEIDIDPVGGGSYDQSLLLKRLCLVLNRWNHKEIHFVRRAVESSQTPCIRRLSVLVNHLGNGWIYLIVALLLFALQGSASLQLILTAGFTAAVAHAIYPLVKKRIARLRPCDYDPTVNLSVKVLDRYSCPSGHVMTSTAVCIPLAMTFPKLLPIIIGCWSLIAWARISLGHHYPSDLLIGFLLGSAIALPMSYVLL